MGYWTLAWLMALICGVALPAGAATLAGGFFDEPIIPPHAYEKLVGTMAKTRGVMARNITAKAAVPESGILAATTANSKAGSFHAVDNALLVSVNGNTTVNEGMGNRMTYNKTTVASVNNSYNNFNGVVNLNVTSGNLNTQTANYSGPDLSANGLLANGGSTKVAPIRK
jgi:hypothetical protein